MSKMGDALIKFCEDRERSKGIPFDDSMIEWEQGGNEIEREIAEWFIDEIIADLDARFAKESSRLTEKLTIEDVHTSCGMLNPSEVWEAKNNW